MKTSKAAQAIMILRAAIYDDSGEDRDVLPTSPFKSFKRNGMDLQLELPGKTFKCDEEPEWAVALTRDNMESVEGWDEYEAQDD